MRETVTSADGRIFVLPTVEEDQEITDAALIDPDCPPITEDEWEEIRLRLVRGGKVNISAK